MAQADSAQQKPPSCRERLQSAIPLLRMIGAECIGSFFLMFFLCGVTMGNQISHGNMDYLASGIAAACGITIIIFTFGHISGAHVNPAITIGFASVGKFPWLYVPWYSISQLVGGILGCLIGRALYGVDLRVTLSVPPTGDFRAFCMEYMIALSFMALACSVASNAQVTGLNASIPVAASIILNIVIAGPISGASMNPMRALAPAIVIGNYNHVWISPIASPLGTISGAWLHKVLTMSTQTRQATNHAII